MKDIGFGGDSISLPSAIEWNLQKHLCIVLPQMKEPIRAPWAAPVLPLCPAQTRENWEETGSAKIALTFAIFWKPFAKIGPGHSSETSPEQNNSTRLQSSKHTFVQRCLNPQWWGEGSHPADPKASLHHAVSLQCPDALPFLWKHFTAWRGKVEKHIFVGRFLSYLSLRGWKREILCMWELLNSYLYAFPRGQDLLLNNNRETAWFQQRHLGQWMLERILFQQYYSKSGLLLNCFKSTSWAEITHLLWHCFAVLAPAKCSEYPLSHSISLLAPRLFAEQCWDPYGVLPISHSSRIRPLSVWGCPTSTL